jgi:hypothetical protein
VSGVTETTPVRDIPVAVPGDLVLVREDGIVVCAGAFTVSSTGFEFEIRVVADESDPAVRLPKGTFSVERDWRADCTWMSIRYSDGRACDASTLTCAPPGDESGRKSADIVVKPTFAPDERSSRWWVSPLPPPGPLAFTIHLDGRAGPVGTASLDAGPLLAAAAIVESAGEDE